VALLLVRVEVLGDEEPRGNDVLKRNSSPWVSWVVLRKVIRSRVIGFSITSPALATGRSFVSFVF
jgi:hypothetical protein